MRTNKYTYLKVIQQSCGQGWEDVSEYETDSTGAPKEKLSEKWASGEWKQTGKQTLLAHDLKEYKTLGYPTRVIRRKELKNA